MPSSSPWCLATATYFFGTETEIGSRPLMPEVPTTPEAIAVLKKRVYDNADLFVGNLVSADGTAAMIRAKIKEGIANRYQAYFAIKGIIGAETGEGGAWWPGGEGDWKKWSQKAGAGPEQAAQGEGADGEKGAAWWRSSRACSPSPTSTRWCRRCWWSWRWSWP